MPSRYNNAIDRVESMRPFGSSSSGKSNQRSPTLTLDNNNASSNNNNNNSSLPSDSNSNLTMKGAFMTAQRILPKRSKSSDDESMGASMMNSVYGMFQGSKHRPAKKPMLATLAPPSGHYELDDDAEDEVSVVSEYETPVKESNVYVPHCHGSNHRHRHSNGQHASTIRRDRSRRQLQRDTTNNKNTTRNVTLNNNNINSSLNTNGQELMSRTDAKKSDDVFHCSKHVDIHFNSRERESQVSSMDGGSFDVELTSMMRGQRFPKGGERNDEFSKEMNLKMGSRHNQASASSQINTTAKEDLNHSHHSHGRSRRQHRPNKA
jgi:hypothetical protein